MAMATTRGAVTLALALSVGCSSSSGTPSADSGPTTEAGLSRDGGTPHDAHTANDASALRDAATDVVAKHDVGSARDASTADAPTTPHDAGSSDANVGADANHLDPAIALASCAGMSMTLTLSNEEAYVDVPVGTEKGQFVLDYGSNFSFIDLSAFAAPGPTTTGCIRADVGGLCSVSDFAFFTAPMTVNLTAANYSGLTGTVRQAGIIGTDLLGQYVITLDYAGGHVYASPEASFCSASTLGSAGFVPLSVAGFFQNDTSTLEPFTDVDDAGDSQYTVPDVPTVAVQLDGIAALAQLDTGFSDLTSPYAVNINDALFAAVNGAHPGALVRDASLDQTLTTCEVDVSETVRGYRLATGAAFALGPAGAVARSYPNATIFLKETPDAAVSCGGISTWSVPAAQVGASFFDGMQALVFDPFSARVWIPKD